MVRSTIPASPASLYAYHARPGALLRLVPPFQRVEVLDPGQGLREGSRVVLRVRKGGLALRWVALHSGVIENARFVDEQIQGPFAFWRHEHLFLPGHDPTSSVLEDRIQYRLPGGAIGRALAAEAIAADLERLFRFRHARTIEDLTRLTELRAALGHTAPLKVAISGSRGLIGSSLATLLTLGGHEVRPLVRAGTRELAPGEIAWTPPEGGSPGQVDEAALEGLDAVVHLAGASIAARWTPAHKAAIRDSRVEGTRLMSTALSRLKSPPRVFVSASGIGFYGDRRDQELAEDAALGSGFLAEVARDWEAAAEPARRAGIRTALLRIGAVVAGSGGAVRTLAPLFRLGLGVIPGSGRQWLSWISLDDCIAVILRTLVDAELAGPINTVAPHPARVGIFCEALARALDRPLLARVPGFLMKPVAGELADEALKSCRAIPEVLRRHAFRYHHPDLDQAMHWAMGMCRPEGDAPGSAAGSRPDPTTLTWERR